MASYDAVVNLNVVGTSRLNRVASAVGELNSLTQDLNKSFNLLRPGAGKLGDKLRTAFEPIRKFARDATNGVAQFSNTLKGATQQAQVFKTVLENVKIEQGGFSRQNTDVKNLANAWAEATIRVSNYDRRLKKLQETALANKGLMMLSSGEIAAGTEAGVGIQGPRLPAALGGGLNLPEGVSRLAAPGLRSLQGVVSRPGAADAIIGAGFPALFGGGPGSIIGGAAGGLAGGAMGGMAGMALSIALSAVGQQLDQVVKKFADLGQAIQRLNVDAVRDSFIFVNRELDTTVRRLIEAGQYEQARGVLAAEVARQTGASAREVRNSTEAVNRLQETWSSITKSVGGLISIIATPLLNNISNVLKVVSLIATGASKVVSFVRQLVDSTIAWVAKLVGAERLYEKIKNFIPFITEEQEKVRAAADASIESGVSDLRLKKQLLDVERARLEGSNRIAQQSQLDAEFTKTTLTVEKELRDEIKRINREGTDLTDQQRALQIALAEGVAKQKLDEALITKEKAEQKLLNDALIASLRDQADAQQAQATQYAKAQSSAAQILQIELQRLQQRIQFVTSLNQEASLIDQTASKRKELAEVEYQAAVAAANSAVQQAAAEYDILQTKYKQNNADIEQVNDAQRKLQTAIQARGLDIEIAGLKREQALETAEIERRQQQLNAYTKEYERINAGVLRSIEEQTNALSNRATLLGAISQATQTINGIEIESLSRELERTSNVARRAEIIDRIYKLEVQNARVILEATRAQIQADIARANMAYKQVELEYQKYRAVVLQAEAQGIVNSAHYEALRAQESALRMAKDNLDTSYKVAEVQLKAADAVYKAAVDAAELKKQMGSTAEAAGQFAGNLEKASQAMGGIVAANAQLGATTQGAPFAAMGGALSIKDPTLQKKALAIWEQATKDAEGKDVGLMADIFQKARDEIAKLALKEAAGKVEYKTDVIKDLNETSANIYKSLLGEDFEPMLFTNDLEEMRTNVYKGLLGKDFEPILFTDDVKEMRKNIYDTLKGISKEEEQLPAVDGVPIPTVQPLDDGAVKPSAAQTGATDRMPATINLQTGPVLQQEDGSKYVSLSDLENILQDFAAVVFNNARTAGGRRYQGVG